MSAVQTISPVEFQRYRDASPSITLIDVRTAAEYDSVHAERATNLPLDRISAAAVEPLRSDPAVPLYVICKSGGRAAKACQKLMDEGVANVISVAGGTDAWVDAGLPTVRGAARLSLEQQVRIAAGVVVLTGVVLGTLVHPAFYAIPAFAGLGLIVAGATGWCGMGLLLARMPWNQRSATCKVS